LVAHPFGVACPAGSRCGIMLGWSESCAFGAWGLIVTADPADRPAASRDPPVLVPQVPWSQPERTSLQCLSSARETRPRNSVLPSNGADSREWPYGAWENSVAWSGSYFTRTRIFGG
jgi:hypothetical protein